MLQNALRSAALHNEFKENEERWESVKKELNKKFSNNSIQEDAESFEPSSQTSRPHEVSKVFVEKIGDEFTLTPRQISVEELKNGIVFEKEDLEKLAHYHKALKEELKRIKAESHYRNKIVSSIVVTVFLIATMGIIIYCDTPYNTGPVYYYKR